MSRLYPDSYRGRIYPASYRRRIHSGSYGLDAIDVAILSTLAFLAEHGRDDGWFTVTQKEIAERLGMRSPRTGKPSDKTIRRRLPSLEQRGFIEIQTTARNGHYQASAYRLSLPLQRSQSPMERDENSPLQRSQSPTLRRSQSPPAAVTESERLRSKSLGGVDDGAARSSVGVNDLESQSQNRDPLPPTTPGGVVEVAEQIVERASIELRNDPLVLEPSDYLAVSCPDCGAQPDRDCRAVPPPGAKLQPARGERPAIHFPRLMDVMKRQSIVQHQLDKAREKWLP